MDSSICNPFLIFSFSSTIKVKIVGSEMDGDWNGERKK